jgi:hypothetical protein
MSKDQPIATKNTRSQEDNLTDRLEDKQTDIWTEAKDSYIDTQPDSE